MPETLSSYTEKPETSNEFLTSEEIKSEVLWDIDSKNKEIVENINKKFPGIVTYDEKNHKIKFTAKLNNCNHQEVLEFLFAYNNENMIYDVDYSACADETIRKILWKNNYYMIHRHTRGLIYQKRHNNQNIFSSTHKNTEFQLCLKNPLEVLWDAFLIEGMQFSVVSSFSKNTYVKTKEFVIQQENPVIEKTEQEKNKDLNIDKENLEYWITQLKTIIQNYQAEYSENQYCKSMIILLERTLESLSNTPQENIGKDNIIQNVITPFLNLRKEFKSYNAVSTFWLAPQYAWSTVLNLRINAFSDTINDGWLTWESLEQLHNIFFWDTETQNNNLRLLWETFQVYDKTHTSFLAEVIKWNLKIKSNKGNNENNEEKEENHYQEFLDDLEERFNVNFAWDMIQSDGTINHKNETIQQLDSLYQATDNFQTFTSVLKNIVWKFPEDPKEIKEDSELWKGITTFMNALKDKKEKSEAYTKEQFMQSQTTRRLQLKNTPLKTDQQEYEYLWLSVLLANKEDDNINTILECNYNCAKTYGLYGEIGSNLKLSLFDHYAKLAGGVEGSNAELYSDIKGLDWYISDENTKIYGEIGVEIGIFILTTYLTAGIGDFVVGGILTLWSNAKRCQSLINISQKAIAVMHTPFRKLNAAGKLWKIGLFWLSKFIEAPIFNNVHALVKSWLMGTPFEADLNPISRNNIQTAAFLGVLWATKALNWPIKDLTMGKIFKSWLGVFKKTLGMTVDSTFEFWEMLFAEELMNLTFWYEVIDPETWEVIDPETWEIVKERGFRLPTQEEIVTIIGMILWAKAVKKPLWTTMKWWEWKLYPTKKGTDPNKKEFILYNKSTKLMLVVNEKGDVIRSKNVEIRDQEKTIEGKEEIEDNATFIEKRFNDHNFQERKKIYEDLRDRITKQYEELTGRKITLDKKDLLAFMDVYEIEPRWTWEEIQHCLDVLDSLNVSDEFKIFLFDSWYFGAKAKEIRREHKSEWMLWRTYVECKDLKEWEKKRFWNMKIKREQWRIVLTEYVWNIEEPVVIPEGVEVIAEGAFMRSNITEIACPKTLDLIRPKAFFACRNLKKISLNEGLLEIHDQAFKCCSSLEEVTLPNTLQTSHREIFRHCTSLRSVNFQKLSYNKIRSRLEHDCFNNTPIEKDVIIELNKKFNDNQTQTTQKQGNNTDEDFKVSLSFSSKDSGKVSSAERKWETSQEGKNFLNIKWDEIKEKWAADLITTITEALESENAVENLDKIFNDFLNYIKENKHKENFKQEVFESLTEFFNDYQYITRIGESYNQIPPTSVKVFSNKSLWEKFYQLTWEEWGTCKYRSLFFKDFFDQINTAWEFWFRNIIMYENTPGHSCVRVESDIWTYMIDRYYDNAFAKIEPQNFSNTMKDYFRYFYDKENYPGICQEFEDVNQYLAAADKRELIKYWNNRRFKDAFEKWENDIPYDSRRFSVTKNNKTLKFRDTPWRWKKKNIVDIIISEDSFSGPETFWEKIYDKLSDEDKIDVREGFGWKNWFINYLNTYIDQEALKENFHETWNKNSTTQETSTTPFLTNKLHRIDFQNMELDLIDQARVTELFWGKKPWNLILLKEWREDFYGILENLKRLNCFDKLMLESIKENKNQNAREVKIPLGSEDGIWIKVTKDEILNKDKRNLFQGTFWDRLLEVAFLKQQFLNLPSEGNEIITNKQAAIRNGDYVELTTDNFRRVGKSNLSTKDLLWENTIDYTLDSQSKENFFDQFNPWSQMVELKPLGNTADKKWHIFITPIDDMKMGDKSLDDLFWWEVQNVYDKEPPEIKEIYKDLESYRPYLDEQNLNLPPNYMKDIWGYISDKHVYLLTWCKTINGEKRCFFVDVRDTSKEFNLSFENVSKLFQRNVEELNSNQMFDQSRKQE